MHTLWRWRTSPDRVEDIWPPAHTEAVLCNALKASLRDLRWTRAATPHTAAAIQLIRDAMPSPPTNSVRASDPAAHYLLYFDGGSRGNPGPGGSGAVMVKLTSNNAHAEVVFTSATAHPDPSTTNNQAEYDGLIKGLQAAAAHSWTPLSVIGDSMIIIRQMRTYTSPLNRTLQGKYAHARRLADGLDIKHWDHHPRAANKMADAAANLAMDTKTNGEEHHPTDNERHQDIATLLPGDIAHWREVHP